MPLLLSLILMMGHYFVMIAGQSLHIFTIAITNSWWDTLCWWDNATWYMPHTHYHTLRWYFAIGCIHILRYWLLRSDYAIMPAITIDTIADDAFHSCHFLSILLPQYWLLATMMLIRYRLATDRHYAFSIFGWYRYWPLAYCHTLSSSQ